MVIWWLGLFWPHFATIWPRILHPLRILLCQELTHKSVECYMKSEHVTFRYSTGLEHVTRWESASRHLWEMVEKVQEINCVNLFDNKMYNVLPTHSVLHLSIKRCSLLEPGPFSLGLSPISSHPVHFSHGSSDYRVSVTGNLLTYTVKKPSNIKIFRNLTEQRSVQKGLINLRK